MDIAFDLGKEFDFSERRIALVGGAGFIGHNIALQLKKLGAEVMVLDGLQVNNLISFVPNSGSAQNQKLYSHFIHERFHMLELAEIPLVVQDARDYSALTRILANFKPDAVIHLAAVAHANRANKDPFTTFDHSLRTLENSLDFARQMDAHFIFLSSSMVYGNFMGDSVGEDTPCDPLGIYAALKFAAEKIIIAYNQVFNLPYTIIRPSALYGERCVSRRVGQAFIENALRGIDLTVNGDGTDRLDFTYIGDFVQGVVRVLNSPASRNQTFNITYGEGRQINELAELVRQHFPSISIQHNPRDALMPERGTLRVDKARELLGYKPAFPIERGFGRYIEWYKQLAAANPRLFGG